MDTTGKERGGDKILVYGASWCPDCKRVKKFFGEQRIPFENVDIEDVPEGMEFVERVNGGKRIIPTILFQDGSVLVEPTDAELAKKLGLQTTAQRAFYDAIVVGGGPTGLTAAFYLAREGLDTLVVEKSGLGGQAGITQMIENFPGFSEGISGAEFARRLEEQARRFDVEILQAQTVVDISPEGSYMCVTTADGSQYGSRAVLLATGARYRKLGVPGEDELIGVNVHFCATCDGAFYKGDKVLVVGGGNSGFEEGLFLTKFASQVDIVEFMPEVKASRILQEKVSQRGDMNVKVNHAVKKFIANGKLEAVVVEDRQTGEVKEWSYDGVFVFVGVEPNSSLARERAQVDENGFVITDRTLMTSIPGLFAAGDVRSGSTKQAAAAAGEGATAAVMIRSYLEETD